MHLPSSQSTENYRVIQSVNSEELHKENQKLQSNFWGFSLFTLLLVLAVLSLLNLVNNKNGPKDY
jgi:hypothetical protein